MAGGATSRTGSLRFRRAVSCVRPDVSVVIRQKFSRSGLKFPNMDRARSAVNEQRADVHKLLQFARVRSRFLPRPLDHLVARHDLCVELSRLLLKPGRDVDGVTDEGRAEAVRNTDRAGPDRPVLQADRDRGRVTADADVVEAERLDVFEDLSCASQRSRRAVGPACHVAEDGQYAISLVRVELTLEARYGGSHDPLEAADQTEYSFRRIVGADPHEMVQIDEHRYHLPVAQRRRTGNGIGQ